MNQISLPQNAKFLSADSLWGLLKELSEKLTEKTNDALKLIDAKNVARVQLSLLRKWEGMKEIDVSLGRRIYGEYYPEFAEIYIYLGNVIYDANPNSYVNTLFHEMIHHLQFTGHHLAEVHLDMDENRRIHMSLPYFARPHEIEAFSKSQSLLKDLESKDPRLLEEIRDIISRAVQFAKMLLREFKIRIEFQDTLFALMKSFHIIQINPPDAPNAPFNVIIRGSYTRAYGKAYYKGKVFPSIAILIPDGIISDRSLNIKIGTKLGELCLRNIELFQEGRIRKIEGTLIFDNAVLNKIPSSTITLKAKSTHDLFHSQHLDLVGFNKNIEMEKSDTKVTIKYQESAPDAKLTVNTPTDDSEIVIVIDRVDIIIEKMPKMLKDEVKEVLEALSNKLSEYRKMRDIDIDIPDKLLEKFIRELFGPDSNGLI